MTCIHKDVIEFLCLTFTKVYLRQERRNGRIAVKDEDEVKKKTKKKWKKKREEEKKNTWDDVHTWIREKESKKTASPRRAKEQEHQGKRNWAERGKEKVTHGLGRKKDEEREDPWCGCRMDSMMKHRMTQGKKGIQWVKYENGKNERKRKSEWNQRNWHKIQKFFVFVAIEWEGKRNKESMRRVVRYRMRCY